MSPDRSRAAAARSVRANPPAGPLWPCSPSYRSMSSARSTNWAPSWEDRDHPEVIAGRIKQRVREAVGERITCSIGCAPNRWLAKIAADLDKPDGLTVLSPGGLPGPLLSIGLEALPGVGRRMRARLERAGLSTVEDLWNSDPGQLRSAWDNVNGARCWYALHGYAVEPPRTQRRSIGHGRVLPPGQRRTRPPGYRQGNWS